MIGRLTGRLEVAPDDTALIDVGGVGYVVQASARTLGRFAAGATVSLLVETHVREDAITLYGFADGDERAWFRLLTGVQGVGPRVALAVLSALAPDALLTAIAAGDVKALTRADGVGPRLAGRILSELGARVASLPRATPAAAVPGGAAETSDGSATPPDDALAADAISALVNLGYDRSLAFTTVMRLAPDAGDLSGLIRSALRDMAS